MNHWYHSSSHTRDAKVWFSLVQKPFCLNLELNFSSELNCSIPIPHWGNSLHPVVLCTGITFVLIIPHNHYLVYAVAGLILYMNATGVAWCLASQSSLWLTQVIMPWWVFFPDFYLTVYNWTLLVSPTHSSKVMWTLRTTHFLPDELRSESDRAMLLCKAMWSRS